MSDKLQVPSKSRMLPSVNNAAAEKHIETFFLNVKVEITSVVLIEFCVRMMRRVLCCGFGVAVTIIVRVSDERKSEAPDHQ
jgi:hypothetical protein